MNCSSVQRLDAALLGRCQLVGHDECRQSIERRTDRVELDLELGRARRAVRVLLAHRPEELERTLEERASVALAGPEERAQQHQSLAVRERVSRDGGEGAILVGVVVSSERHCERCPDGAAGNGALRVG